MAGSFGFEDGHYEVSCKIGELVLLPAIRRAAKDTLIIADGFSCREQIRQATDREALHTSQVLQLALAQQAHRRPEGAIAKSEDLGIRSALPGLPAYPEKVFIEQREREYAKANRQTIWATAAAVLALIVLWSQRKKRVL